MLNIGIEITANSFNDKWPCVKIHYNNRIIDDVRCTELTKLQYNVDPDIKNTLVIELYNKSFGDNDVWDVNANGQGLDIQVTNITLDNVSIDHLLNSLEFETLWTKNQLLYESAEFKSKYSKYISSGMLSFNGKLTFEFETPVFDFLIDKKYKVLHNTELAYFSNSTETFHYEMGLAKVEEIKQLIKANHD